jgi:hypothetical protein
MISNDVNVLRELARRVAEIAAKPVQEERRQLWRRHNSLQRTRPLVLMRGMPFWPEVFPDDKLQCRDLLFRSHEKSLRQLIHQDRLADDSVIEPFITVGAVRATLSGDERWGAAIRFIPPAASRGAGIYDPPIKTEADIAKIQPQPHRIDGSASAERLRRIQDALGDILSVHLDRAPLYSGWHADMSTDVARLAGIEQFMLYMLDRPAWLHRVQGMMRDAVLAQHEQAERAGDWRLFHHNNQAMSYSQELPGPGDHFEPVPRDRLWVFFASQETTLVSPAMFDEFVLQYQISIMRNFGLSAYGCCEDLTRKIALLRKIPNLRRIAVTAWADVARCAEQIGTQFVFSWRPSPAETICNSFDPDKTRKIIQEGLAACNGCHVDITFKDVETVNGRFDDLVACVRVAREVAEQYA